MMDRQKDGRTDRRTGKNNMSPDPVGGDIKILYMYMYIKFVIIKCELEDTTSCVSGKTCFDKCLWLVTDMSYTLICLLSRTYSIQCIIRLRFCQQN